MTPATYDDISAATSRGARTLSWGNTFNRVEALPLDKYSVFPNYSEALAYAAGQGRYEGLAYEGQVIVVSSEAGQKLYIVDGSAPGYLREAGNSFNTAELSSISSDIIDLSSKTVNLSSALNGKANATHSHGINTITNLRNELNGKAESLHTHQISSVDGLSTQLAYILQVAQTGGGSGGDGMIGYTVNGKVPDENGNFEVGTSEIGAAAAEHFHEISDIVGLQTELDGKSPAVHSHTMVTGIVVNGQQLSGNVQIKGDKNVEVQQDGQTVKVSITPYQQDQTDAVSDAETGEPYKIFVGTDAEWTSFKATIPEDSHYLVFIRS